MFRGEKNLEKNDRIINAIVFLGYVKSILWIFLGIVIILIGISLFSNPEDIALITEGSLAEKGVNYSSGALEIVIGKLAPFFIIAGIIIIVYAILLIIASRCLASEKRKREKGNNNTLCSRRVLFLGFI